MAPLPSAGRARSHRDVSSEATLDNSLSVKSVRQITQSIVVASPRQSLLSSTKRKMTDLKQRIASAVKRPRKKRGKRSHSLPARNFCDGTNTAVLNTTFIDGDDAEDFFPGTPTRLRYSCPEPPFQPMWSTSQEVEFPTSPCRPSSSRKSVSASGVPQPVRDMAADDDRTATNFKRHRRSSSWSQAVDKWDSVRRDIRASQQQPLPHAVGTLSDRKQLSRKFRYVKDKWMSSSGKRLDIKPKTHYQEPWWRNILRSTINWMCPFVIVSKQGDVYCVPKM